MNNLKHVKTGLLAALSLLAVTALAGCAADEGYGAGFYGPPYGGGVYYDGYYGPYPGGYWGDDGFFYYDDGDGRFDRDEGHHFRHQAFEHSERFHADSGHDHGHGG